MWTFFKVAIEFVATLLLFHVLSFWPWGMWDLSSPTRDQTPTPCIGRWSPNHWTTREGPLWSFSCLSACSPSWSCTESLRWFISKPLLQAWCPCLTRHDVFMWSSPCPKADFSVCQGTQRKAGADGRNAVFPCTGDLAPFFTYMQPTIAPCFFPYQIDSFNLFYGPSIILVACLNHF